MQIKSVYLNSFGKFQKKTVDFVEGVNVVIGDNEAGKTTIHQFIQGMFYGFYKPNLKSKKLSPLHDKYLPWDNYLEFNGSMIVEDEHHPYRIDRNFMRDSDTVSVFDNVTGENIDHLYSYDPVTKVINPGEKHLGMNLVTYENTISISQMNSSTSEELLSEIKENLMNLSQARSLTLSVNNALAEVATKKSKIGTKRSKKSPFGQLIEKAESLENDKANLENNTVDLYALQKKEKALFDDLKQLDVQKERVEQDMKYYKVIKKKEKYDKALKLEKEMNDVANAIEELKVYKGFDQDVVDGLQGSFKDIEVNEAKIQQVQEQDDKLQIDIKNLEEKIMAFSAENMHTDDGEEAIDVNQLFEVDSLAQDIYRYEGLEGSKTYIEQGYNEEHLNDKKSELSRAIKQQGGLGAGLIISFIIFVVLSVIAFQTIFNLVLIGAGVMLGIVLLFLMLYLFKLKGINVLKSNINELESNKNLVNMRLSETNEKQKELLKHYDVNSYEALKALYDTVLTENNEVENLQIELGHFKEQLVKFDEQHKEYESSVKAYKKEQEKARKVIGKVLKPFGIEAETGIKEGLEKHYEYKQLTWQYNDLQKALLEITDGEPVEKLAVKKELPKVANNKSYEALEDELKGINEEVVRINKEIVEVGSEVTKGEEIYNQVLLTEEALGATKNEIEHQTFKYQTLELIEQTIGKISERIQNNFAPQLNEELSKIVGVATDYRYTEVRVDKNMAITVIDNDTNKMVDILTLSAGTVDLMYFALRMALADIVTGGKNVPLLLDDSFVQYDDRRFKNVVKVLEKLGRQIIIFTCHKREKKVSNRVMDDVHIIRL